MVVSGDPDGLRWWVTLGEGKGESPSVSEVDRDVWTGTPGEESEGSHTGRGRTGLGLERRYSKRKDTSSRHTFDTHVLRRGFVGP